MSDFEIKGPQDLLLDLPQERITGDLLRGYGPRRGNLERLLRYWRPIMRKPGGFRRCKAILANHPELYPLNNICAWLHHETTGLWPNEGCHHPGMKNCKKKLKGVVKGSIWSDAEFNKRIRKMSGKKKSADQGFEEQEDYVVTNMDMDHAVKVLADFLEMEKKFCSIINDDNNWEIEGEDEWTSDVKSLPFVRTEDMGCC
jgi:hypothetical protein